MVIKCTEADIKLRLLKNKSNKFINEKEDD